MLKNLQKAELLEYSDKQFDFPCSIFGANDFTSIQSNDLY